MQVKGKIIYAVVAQLKPFKLFSEFTDYNGNFQQTLQVLLQKLKPNLKISYTSDE